MAKKKNTDTVKNKIQSTFVKDAGVKPIPPFKNLEEEANFWDSHSVVDDIDEGTIVGFHRANKDRTLSVRFAEKDIQTLRREAFRRGIGPTTLARMWLLEKLQNT